MAKVFAELHFEIASLTDTEFGELRQPGADTIPSDRLHKCFLGGDEFCRVGQTVAIDEPLCLGECLTIERRDAACQIVHECVKVGVRKRAVDPAITFGSRCVEIIASKEDLESACAADDNGKALDGAAPRNKADRHFRLAEDRFLQTGETQIASE